MSLRRAAGAVLAATMLGGCQTKPVARDYSEFRSNNDPVATASLISRNVRACWLRESRPAFAAYTSAAELTSYSNRPRVLIVAKDDREGLPKLVIEASQAERGARVKLFGPLMASPEAAAIRRDVSRWADGASGC